MNSLTKTFKTWSEYEDNARNYDSYIHANLMLTCIRKIEEDYKITITQHKHVEIEQINHQLFMLLFNKLFSSNGKTFKITKEPNKIYRNDTIEYTILDYLLNDREEVNLIHYEDYTSVDFMYHFIKIIDDKLYNQNLMFNSIVELTDVFSTTNKRMNVN